MNLFFPVVDYLIFLCNHTLLIFNIFVSFFFFQDIASRVLKMHKDCLAAPRSTGWCGGGWLFLPKNPTPAVGPLGLELRP